MSKIETGKTENTQTARVLRDDELDSVNGGAFFLKVEQFRTQPLIGWL